MTHRIQAAGAALAVVAIVATGCASVSEPVGTPRKEHLYVVTDSHQLVRINAGQPGKILSKVALAGLQGGDEVVGIDYRVARGILYALTRGGRLYTVDPASGTMKQVGADKFAVSLDGVEFGMDFNPTVDRIRIVSDSGQNMRAHPDTGALVDGNPNEPGVQTDLRLGYATGDINNGQLVRIMAAAYSYNKTNDKITTNYAIDGRLGLLVTQGTKEGVTPAVSPNSGQLFTVGPLGVGESDRVAFDIADVNNAAFAAFTGRKAGSSRLYEINLATGKASLIGTIGGGEAIRGMAIEP